MATLNKLTGQPLNDLTLFAVDTLANPLAPQANDVEPTTLDTYGHGLEQLLANYDPNTQSWKTSEDTSLWGDYELLASLPKSGMTRSGALYLQPEWVRPIDATELLSWPTPTAVTRPMEGNVRLYRAKIQAGEMTEAEAEAILGKSVWEALGKLPEMWPTPTTQEIEHLNAELTATGRRKSKNGKTSHSLGLADAVQMWPTPTARDWKGAAGFKNPKRNLADLTYLAQVRAGQRLAEYPTMSANGMGNAGSQQILQRKVESGELTLEEKKKMTSGHGGSLNPTWVEWLMGFPLGWTDLED
jgi:DNA (cytosine-5)-methyltransferase 1